MICKSCGHLLSDNDKFCPECGRPRLNADPGWECPICGTKGITSKFCPECGTAKPVVKAEWKCPSCGTDGITSKFCPECGHKRDDE